MTQHREVLGHLPCDTRHRVAWFALLAVAVAAFHAGWLDEPLAALQLNAGLYFGVFAKNWQSLGFWDLRGLPLMHKVVAAPADGYPYVHHPPALSWLFFALGGKEWSMRLPSVIAGFVAAIFWYRIARTKFAPAASFWSACLLVFCPCYAVVSQASYEILVACCGLAVIAEIAAPVSPRWLSLLIQATAAFVGTWVDWGFAFFCLACVPMAWKASLSQTVRRLALPGAVAGFAAATIVAWQHWALAQPGLRQLPAGDTHVADMVSRFLLGERAPWSWRIGHLVDTVGTTWSRWLVGTFLLGIGVACWRSPRLTLAMGIAAIGPLVALNRPADFIWHTFHAPLLALCGAALLDLVLGLRPPAIRRAAGIGAFVVLVGVALASWRLRAEGATPFFARLGNVLSAVAREPGWAAAHNCPTAITYYFDAPRIELQGLYVPEQIQPLVAGKDGYGWKYLWLKPVNPGLVLDSTEHFLAQFPRERVPLLEGPLDVVGTRLTGGIAEAWLYTLSRPPH